MQISRRVLIACVSAGFLSSAALPAADTEAQIKAREALDRALRGETSAPARAIVPPPVQTPTRPATPVTAAPATAPRPAVPPSLRAPQASTPEQIERAREALRQQLQQSSPTTQTPRQAPPITSPTVPAPRTTPPVAQPPVRPPQTTPMTTGTPTIPAIQPVAATPEQIEKAREALRQQLQQTETGTTGTTGTTTATTATPSPRFTFPATTPQPTPTASGQAGFSGSTQFPPLPAESNPQATAKAREALRNALAQSVSEPATVDPLRERNRAERDRAEQERIANDQMRQQQRLQQSQQTRRPRVTRENDEFEPIQGPPTGFSTGKEQRLKELLDRYMADEVTPDQYHAERAKILAEP